MQIIEVSSAADAKDFISANVLVNKGNKNYIRPIDNEINEIFNTAKNKQFKYGEATRWVLKDGKNIVGRIAAFTHSKYKNAGTEFATGGIGFFDCINTSKRQTCFLILQKAGCKARAWKQWTAR